jgi:hypothetical protein
MLQVSMNATTKAPSVKTDLYEAFFKPSIVDQKTKVALF